MDKETQRKKNNRKNKLLIFFGPNVTSQNAL